MESRYVRWFAAGCLLLLLPGCWNRTEVNDLMLVTGIGIDTSIKEDLTLCVQSFVPGTSHGGQASQPRTIVRCKEGISIADALSKLQLAYSRKLFLGHASALVISKDFAQRFGIREVSDFMVRFPEIWFRMRLAISNSSAESILRWKSPVETNGAEVLREMAKSRHMLGMDVLHYAELIKDEAQAAVLPIIDFKVDGEMSDAKGISSVGTAVFNKDRMVGELDTELTRGLLWFRNEIREATFTITPDKGKGELSLFIIHAQLKLTPRIEDGKWKMTVKVESEDDIAQNETNLDTTDPKVIERLEREAEAVLKERLMETVVRVQKKLNTDILGYAEAFEKKYPQAWKQKKDQWGSLFRQVKTDYDVHVYILRPGEYEPPLRPGKDGGA